MTKEGVVVGCSIVCVEVVMLDQGGDDVWRWMCLGFDLCVCLYPGWRISLRVGMSVYVVPNKKKNKGSVYRWPRGMCVHLVRG